MLVAHVLKRGQHFINVVVALVAGTPVCRLDPGEHVDDDEAVASTSREALQFLQAALVEPGKIVEELEFACICESGLNGK